MRKSIKDDELTGNIRQMKYSTTDPAGANYGYDRSYYDIQGNLVRWERYDEQDKLVKYLVYRFNDQDVLEDETLAESDGRVVYKNSFYANGQYKETCEYYGDDTYKTAYDEAGNVIAQAEGDTATEIEEDPYNEQWETKQITDTDGSIAELQYYYSFGALFDITKRKYDAQAQLISETTYGSEADMTAGKPRSIKINEYNEHHHLVLNTHEDINETGDIRRTIFRYTFTYDTQHNWTEKVEMMNNKITGFQDKIQFIRKREIEYLP
jgi:hypothetical protein